MKGILLAGGRGTRLMPTTLGASKHLLPVYDKPMIYYPLSVLMLAGLREILVISTPEDLPSFRRLLGDGSQFGIALQYVEQARPAGVAEALLIAADFVGKDSLCLILGDNLFFGQNFVPLLQEQAQRRHGACVFAYPVKDPQRFGVVTLDANHRPVSLEEKPASPQSAFAVTGLYFYGNEALADAGTLRPSARGELEITALNQRFLDAGTLDVVRLGRGFAWLDAGTADSLLEASQFVQTMENRQGLKIACLEEIALRNGWIGTNEVSLAAQQYLGTAYGHYLMSLAADGAPPLQP